MALVYDGFTFNAISWIEALGFCGFGEAKDWLDGGRRIALDGELPVNPHGGQLSEGRTHGFGFLYEAVTQLRGDAGERQVAAARDRGRDLGWRDAVERPAPPQGLADEKENGIVRSNAKRLSDQTGLDAAGVPLGGFAGRPVCRTLGPRVDSTRLLAFVVDHVLAPSGRALTHFVGVAYRLRVSRLVLGRLPRRVLVIQLSCDAVGARILRLLLAARV